MITSAAERAYNFLPLPLQSFACSLEGYRLKRRRCDTDFLNLLRASTERTFASRELIISIQVAALEQTFRAALETPYWKTFSELNGAANAPFERLLSLPILHSKIVRKSPYLFVNRKEKNTITARTSGSSSHALIFPMTPDAEKMQYALWWRYRSWHGLTPDTWCGYFGAQPIVPVRNTISPFWRVNLPGKQILFSAYHLSQRRASDYVEALNSMRPPWLHGYPSQLALLASYIKSLNLRLSYRPRLITVGAEMLLTRQHKLIEEVFGCPVRQHYGLAEGVANISECPNGSLHIDEDFSIVELIKDEARDLYRIIGTGLFNPAFPLLRYDTGDLARLSSTQCECGRPGRVISQIVGRSNDVLVLPDRTTCHLDPDSIFNDARGVVEWQIEQSRIDRIVLNIVRDQNYSINDEKKIVDEARSHLGNDINIQIKYVQRVERKLGGKLKFIKSYR